MKPLITNTLSIILIVFTFFSCKDKSTVYKNITGQKDQWVCETQDPENSVITFEDNKMEIITSKGITIWFKEKLEGDVVIEYDATVIDNNGKYDRVSDLNCFWMFSNPKQTDGDIDLEDNDRNGMFQNYHSLQGYYVGLGGHNNSKTRFRRYNGDPNRPLDPEHDFTDSKYLITPNKRYHIKLIAVGNTVQYWRDEQLIYNIDDSDRFTKGWFGIRTVTNHLIVEDVKITLPFRIELSR